jgi:hypothetical protein
MNTPSPPHEAFLWMIYEKIPVRSIVLSLMLLGGALTAHADEWWVSEDQSFAAGWINYEDEVELYVLDPVGGHIDSIFVGDIYVVRYNPRAFFECASADLAALGLGRITTVLDGRMFCMASSPQGCVAD